MATSVNISDYNTGKTLSVSPSTPVNNADFTVTATIPTSVTYNGITYSLHIDDTSNYQTKARIYMDAYGFDGKCKFSANIHYDGTGTAIGSATLSDCAYVCAYRSYSSYCPLLYKATYLSEEITPLSDGNDTFYYVVSGTICNPTLTAFSAQLDLATALTFTWSYPEHSGTQSKYKLQYKGSEDTDWIDFATFVTGTTKSYTVPANTLDADTYQIRVVATGTDNVERYSSTATFIGYYIGDVTLEQPTSSIIDAASPYTLKWQISEGTQVKYQIQYKCDGAYTDLVAETTSTDKENIIPANTFTSTTYTVKVGVKGADDVQHWSNEIQFIAKGKPATPSILTIPTVPRPVIEWSANGQAAYRLQITSDTVNLDTGWTYGTAMTHQFADYLSSGDYTATVQIKNLDDLVSDVATQDFTVSFTAPTKPTVTAESVDNGVKLTITNATATTYILRNDVCIAQLDTPTEYTDYSANGTNTYIVRVVDTDDNFADSDSVEGITTIEYATLSLADDTSTYINLMYSRDEPVSRVATINYNASQIQFAGREYPCYEFDENCVETHSFNYSVTTMAEYNQLLTMISKRQTLLFRNNFGEKIYGVITDISNKYDNKTIDFTLNIATVNYSEVVEYEIS